MFFVVLVLIFHIEGVELMIWNTWLFVYSLLLFRWCGTHRGFRRGKLSCPHSGDYTRGGW